MSVELLDPKDVNCLHVILVGHVDVGKSTMAGHWAYKYAEKTPEFERRMKGFGDKFEFRNFCDRSKTEQARGITQSCHSNAIDITYPGLGTRHFVVCDSPGHQSFTKNLVTGASVTDTGILVVTASPSGLAAYMKSSTLSDKRDATNEDAKGGKKLPSQMDQQTQLLRVFNVKPIIVAVNKMGGSTSGTDTDITPWSESAFIEARDLVAEKMKKMGYDMSWVSFFPTDALVGANLFEKSDKMPWFKGIDFKPNLTNSKYKPEPFHADCLIEALMKIHAPPRNYDDPLRMVVQSTYKVSGVGCVLGVRLVAGVVKVADELFATPCCVPCKVKSIEAHNVPRAAAGSGSDCGVLLTGKDTGKVGKEDTLGPITNPPSYGNVLIVKVNWLGVQDVVNNGFSAIADIGVCHVSVCVDQILEVRRKAEKWSLTGTEPECLTWNTTAPSSGDKDGAKAAARPGGEKAKNKKQEPWNPTSTNAYLNGLEAPLKVEGACTSIIRIKTLRNVCATTYAQCAATGRLSIRNSAYVVGVGVVLQAQAVPIDPKLLPKKK